MPELQSNLLAQCRACCLVSETLSIRFWNGSNSHKIQIAPKIFDILLPRGQRKKLTLAQSVRERFNGAKRRSKMALRPKFRQSMLATGPALLTAMALTVSGASPARADRCDDLAAQLKSQIDGLAVGKTAANLIYLSHPQAKEITLGCASRNITNQLFAKADSRKPQPAFIDLVASAA